MSEKAVWNRIKGGLEKVAARHNVQIHLQRIESTDTASGIPDTNMCFAPLTCGEMSHECWVELKEAEKPARNSTIVFKSQPGMRPAQIDWLRYRALCGGACYVMIAIDGELLLIPGRDAAEINLATYPQLKDLSIWSCLVGRFDLWNDLFNELRGYREQ